MVVITAVLVALALTASTPPSPPPSPAPTSSEPTTEAPLGSTPAEVDYVEADTDLAPGRLYVHLDDVTPAQQEAIDVAFAAQLLEEEAFVEPHLERLEERIPELYYPDSQRWNDLINNVGALRREGVRTRFGRAGPWELHVFSVAIGDEPWRHAQMFICYRDTSVLFEPNGAPDGGDVIINNTPKTEVGWLTLADLDGMWRSYWFDPDRATVEGDDAVCVE